MSSARDDRGLPDRASAPVALTIAGSAIAFRVFSSTTTLVTSAMLSALCMALFVNIHPLF